MGYTSCKRALSCPSTLLIQSLLRKISALCKKEYFVVGLLSKLAIGTSQVRHMSIRGTRVGLPGNCEHLIKCKKHSRQFVHFNPLSLRCSNVSPENCSSSLMVILYLETSIFKMAIPSVPKNLQSNIWSITNQKAAWQLTFFQDKREALNASLGQSSRKRSGLKE